MRTARLGRIFCLVLTFALFALPAPAESGVGADKIILGQMAALDGPDNNRGSNQVFLTIIQSDGRFEPVEKLTKVGG